MLVDVCPSSFWLLEAFCVGNEEFKKKRITNVCFGVYNGATVRIHTSIPYHN